MDTMMLKLYGHGNLSLKSVREHMNLILAAVMVPPLIGERTLVPFELYY